MTRGYNSRRERAYINMPLLEVTGLTTSFMTDHGLAKAVDDVSFTVEEGQTLGLVGESGSGKSVTMLSLMRLVPKPGYIAGGKVIFQGNDLLELNDRDMHRIRGKDIALIPQDPMTSLDPIFTVGSQVGEPIHQHQGLRGRAMQKAVLTSLDVLQISAAETRVNQYPHQLSGGIRQRVVGATALSCHPKLLIADEPTTSLDVTVERGYLRHLRALQHELGFGMIFITHNLGIVAQVCDRLGVMYAGKLVEMGPVKEVLENPQHPYTQALISCVPSLNQVDRLPHISGQPPSLVDLPSGCSFAPRCPHRLAKCEQEYPPVVQMGDGWSRCWLHT